jgi:ATP-dependent RNA helicase RhlE
LSTFSALVRLRVTHVFGGASMGSQIRALRQGTDMVVATPGRLIDHLQRRTIDLSAIEILTLDEADRLLDMGFLPALRQVLAALPRARQTLLFSATLSSEVARLANEFMRNPKQVDVSSADSVAPTIVHRVHPVTSERKRALLLHLLLETPRGQALVFCRTKRGADRVGDHLVGAGLKPAVIHGNKSQGARTRSLADFKAGRATVLVATDIAARGLDIARLPLVINFDLPLVAEDYVHRVGRTGRAGAVGTAVSLMAPEDRRLLRGIQRLVTAPLEPVAVEGFDGTETAPTASQRRRDRGAASSRYGSGRRSVDPISGRATAAGPTAPGPRSHGRLSARMRPRHRRESR